ncbi:hypothetical protein LCGC14_0727310 [marine sediment metagenome]|uniref:Uncharacterized protein n=1 Tax=marine sediment metagenome TaxID=412755 RepID=A0A0F9THT2_9ZZZZ
MDIDVVKEFFTGLRATLTDAFKGDPVEEPAPEVTLESVSKAVAELTAKAEAEPTPAPAVPAVAAEPVVAEGDPVTPATPATPAVPAVPAPTLDVEALQKAVTDGLAPIIEAVTTHTEVLEKALDRIAVLEGGTTVRKSATSDEVSEGDGSEPAPKPDPKDALFKSVAQAIKTKQPVTFT